MFRARMLGRPCWTTVSVPSVLERLEREDAEERERNAPAAVRARQVARTTGRFLYALVAPQTGCEGSAGLLEGDARETLSAIDDVFDLVFLDAEKDDYEELYVLARTKVEPGALIVADNVLSHPEPLARYSAGRQADPTLESLTVPLDRGIELSVVLRYVGPSRGRRRPRVSLSWRYRGKEVVRQ
jgi:hypothetical protein